MEQFLTFSFRKISRNILIFDTSIWIFNLYSFILVCIIVHILYYFRKAHQNCTLDEYNRFDMKENQTELKQNSSEKSQLHFKSLLYYRWGIQILRIDIKWTAFYTHTLLIEYISSLIEKICAPLTAKSLIPIFTPYYF